MVEVCQSSSQSALRALAMSTGRVRYFCRMSERGGGGEAVMRTRFRRVGKAKRAHHLAACSVMDGGHVASRLCPPYGSTVDHRAADLLPRVNTAFDMRGAGQPRILCSRHRHRRAFAEGAEEHHAAA